MPTTVEKDVLRPGTYRLRDGSSHTYTAADIRTAAVNGRAMLAQGNAVPLIWEHDIEAVPVPLQTLLHSVKNPRAWSAGFARNCFGHTEDFDVREETGGPVLYMRNQVYKPEDAARWKAARFCSPRLDRNYCDGDGTVYPGVSVTHLAATPKPIQTNQFPVMLSADAKPIPYRGSVTVFLSNAEEIKMAKDKTDDDADDVVENDDDAAVVVDPPADTGDSGSKGIQRLKAALNSIGVTLPDTASSMADICLSIESIAAHGINVDGGDDDDFADDDVGAMAGAPADTAPSNAPAMMSQIDTTAAGKAIVNAHRKQLIARVELLSKRGMQCGVIDGPYAKELLRKVQGANLSLTAEGDFVRTGITDEIATVEHLVNNAWKGSRRGPGNKRRTVNLSTLGVVSIPNPSGLSDTAQAAAVVAARDEAMKRLTGHLPAAAK